MAATAITFLSQAAPADGEREREKKREREREAGSKRGEVAACDNQRSIVGRKWRGGKRKRERRETNGLNPTSSKQPATKQKSTGRTLGGRCCCCDI
jgi:hypothetical protein